MCSIPPRTQQTTEPTRAIQLPTTDTCPRTGKVAHHHRSAAMAACRVHNHAAKIQGKEVDPMVPYRCGGCSKWHLANADLRNRKKVRPYTKSDRTRWKAELLCA